MTQSHGIKGRNPTSVHNPVADDADNSSGSVLVFDSTSERLEPTKKKLLCEVRKLSKDLLAARALERESGENELDLFLVLDERLEDFAQVGSAVLLKFITFS